MDSRSQFNRDCEAYRSAHGSLSLVPCVSFESGRMFIVKSQTPERVVLLGVSCADEITIPAEELYTRYWLWLPDEAVFLFGTKEQQAAVRAEWASVDDAMSRVLYGNARQLPMVCPDVAA